MATAPHILILEARYYEDVAEGLLKGATGALDDAGASYEVVTVPGALELPGALAIARTEDPNRYDGFILLGCVIRGETSHYDVVVNESTRGTMDQVVRHSLAVGFGILTVENRDQAMVRADVDRKNSGGAAATAALSLIATRHLMRTRS